MARTPGELGHVCATDPADPLCQLRLAQKVEEFGGNSLPYWESAIRLNPRSAPVLTQAAVAVEFSGQRTRAEQLYLQAARFNSTWLPRWTLANFYARHADWPQVLVWSRLALERGYGDRRPLFALCRQAGASDDQILDDVLPPGHVESIESFLGDLLALGFADPAIRAAGRLADLTAKNPGRADSVKSLAYAVEALLGLGRPSEALALWNRLLAERWLDVRAATRHHPLTDPAFEADPGFPPGFSWRVPPVEGVEVNPGVPAGGVKFTVNGKQPESAEMLAQIIHLEGGKRWRLHYEYTTREIPPGPAQIVWRLTPLAGTEPLTAVADGLLDQAEDWTARSAVWDPPESGFYRLSLLFRRVEGYPRQRGEILVRGLRMEALEARR